MNEACLRVAGTAGIEWRDRAHFIGIAAPLMRRLLIDHARRHAFQKRGGGLHKVPIRDESLVTEPRDLDLLALDRALESLTAVDVPMAQVVEMRYFGGMTIEETAGALRVSSDTVKGDWQVASASCSIGSPSSPPHADNDVPLKKN